MRQNGFLNFFGLQILLLFWLPAGLLAADRVVGANATLDINAGARSSALGGTILAIEHDLLGLASNPYQLARTHASEVAFSHTVYYEGTSYDYASLALPLGEYHGLGLAFSRFGADDIPWITENDPIPEGSDYRTLSIADWVFTLAWGKQFLEYFDVGIAFHGLYREMDQSGWGFRGDAGLSFEPHPSFAASALLKGWTSSAARWESGEVEYSSPELYLALRFEQPVHYFYGALRLYWQSAGIFHRENRDLDWNGEPRGGVLWDEPLDWLSGGHAGIEFRFDFGLSLRAGLSSLGELESWTAGSGLELANWLSVDYAFESHPVLSSVHRVSMSFSPGRFFSPEKDYAPRKIRNAVPELEKESLPGENRENTVPEIPEEDSGGTHWEE